MGYDFEYKQPLYTVPLSALLGFIASIAVGHVIIDYVVLFLFGMVMGRMLHHRKYGEKEILVMNIVGFFIGYALGSLNSDWKGLLVMFVVSSVISYKLHDKGIIRRYNL